MDGSQKNNRQKVARPPCNTQACRGGRDKAVLLLLVPRLLCLARGAVDEGIVRGAGSLKNMACVHTVSILSLHLRFQFLQIDFLEKQGVSLRTSRHGTLVWYCQGAAPLYYFL